MIDPFSKSVRMKKKKEICLYERLFIDFKQKKWYCEKKDILFICMNTIRKEKENEKIIIEYLYNEMNNYLESFYLK
jgi:hypothetical protein